MDLFQDDRDHYDDAPRGVAYPGGLSWVAFYMMIAGGLELISCPLVTIPGLHKNLMREDQLLYVSVRTAVTIYYFLSLVAMVLGYRIYLGTLRGLHFPVGVVWLLAALGVFANVAISYRLDQPFDTTDNGFFLGAQAVFYLIAGGLMLGLNSSYVYWQQRQPAAAVRRSPGKNDRRPGQGTG